MTPDQEHAVGARLTARHRQRLGAGTAALGALRFIPGVGGAVADTAWRPLAPQQERVADFQRDSHAAGFRELVGLIEGLRGEHTIAMLKANIAAKAQSIVKDALIIPGKPTTT